MTAPAGAVGRRRATATPGATPGAVAAEVGGAPELGVVADPAPGGHPALLGLVWAAALLTGTALGAPETAVVVAPVAAVAAASALRARDARTLGRPVVLAAGAVAAAAGPAAAAAAGSRVAALVAALVGVAAGAAIVAIASPPAQRSAAVATVAAPAAGAAALVVASLEAGIVGMGLAAAVCLWDLANASTGTGPTGGTVGTVVATVSTAVLAVLFAAIADPPLSGARPWVLFAVVAVGAPLGVRAARRLAGGARLPALRRLDSAVIAGPAWVIGAVVLLHR